MACLFFLQPTAKLGVTPSWLWRICSNLNSRAMTRRPNGSMVSNPQHWLYLLEARAWWVCGSEKDEIYFKMPDVFFFIHRWPWGDFCFWFLSSQIKLSSGFVARPFGRMTKSAQMWQSHDYSWIIQQRVWPPGKFTLPYIYLYKTHLESHLTWMTFGWVLSVFCKSKQQRCFSSSAQGWHLSLPSLLLCNWGSLKQRAGSSVYNEAAMFHPNFAFHVVRQIHVFGFIFPLLIYIIFLICYKGIIC